MSLDHEIRKRFDELTKQMGDVPIRELLPDSLAINKWATSAMSLLDGAFGRSSVHYGKFRDVYDKYQGYKYEFETLCGILLSAKEDYEGGYLFRLESAISGEVFGDFVLLSKKALDEGHKDVAAVLACAALEDALKRYAKQNNLQVDNAVMQEVVNALKSKGLVTGAQKALLEDMPKIRDYAMHANWEKLSPPAVASVLGFVERFLLEHFS